MKVFSIIKSRFKKPIEEEWVLERRKECLSCPFNSKNTEKISFKQKVYRMLSNLLTLVTKGRFNKDDSECTVCGCTLEFKIPERLEYCPKNKWKK